MEAQNAKGGKGAKDMDAQIRVQKALAALNHWVLYPLQSRLVGLTTNYNSALTIDLR